jgi:hypothetical protein
MGRTIQHMMSISVYWQAPNYQLTFLATVSESVQGLNNNPLLYVQ